VHDSFLYLIAVFRVQLGVIGGFGGFGGKHRFSEGMTFLCAN
jgi:hypothetical protein